jgi:hypothetical protein
MFTIYDHIPIHTDNNMLFFGIVVLALALMFIGHSRKMGIFNLLSIPFWVFLGYDLLGDYPFLAVSFLGIIIFEFYWAFWGMHE